jgi:hypothetical protein
VEPPQEDSDNEMAMRQPILEKIRSADQIRVRTRGRRNLEGLVPNTTIREWQHDARMSSAPIEHQQAASARVAERQVSCHQRVCRFSQYPQRRRRRHLGQHSASASL